jgi:FAD/FMN-containing dehydrogenase
MSLNTINPQLLFFNELSTKDKCSIPKQTQFKCSVKNQNGETISQFIEDTNKIILERFVHIRMVVFGHLGDGNLHYNLSPSTDLDSNQSKLFTNQELHINKLVHDAVNKLNGSISAEHGLGVLRKDEASRYRSMTEKHLMATLKNAFDPQNIMNPGKFLD